MIYPDNVYQKLTDSRKLIGNERALVAVYLLIGVNVILFIVLRAVCSMLELGTLVRVLTQVILDVIIFIFVFRFFIFNEQERLAEQEESTQDSFARFLNVRRDSEFTSEVLGKEVHGFEYTNGCSAAILEFKYGANDNRRANACAILLDRLLTKVETEGFSIRFITMPEKFENSREFQRYTEQINAVRDTSLSAVLREMADEALRVSQKGSKVDSLFALIQTNAPYRKEDLLNLVAGFINEWEEMISGFRSVSSLNISAVFELFRDFSTVEAIDLSMTKALDFLNKENVEGHVVEVYSLISQNSGEIVNEKVLNRYFKLDERRLNND